MEATPAFEDWTDRDPALGLPHRRKMQILFAILLGMFLSALDQTIVGTSLPTITRDLNGSAELYTWVVTIYLLTATITGVFYGKLSDIYGRRLMLLIGISIFLIGSGLSGLSWSMESLIVFRGVQGVGAGAIFPISIAVIGDLFSPRERGKYQGLIGAVFGISAIMGPLLGGWLTQNLSWNWIFFVNIPIGLVALAIIYRFLPSVHGEKFTRNLDYLGAGVFTVAVSLLLIGLTNKQTQDWSEPWVGGAILVSLVFGLMFLLVETRAAEPIVPLELFKNRGYAVTILVAFLTAMGFFGAILYLPLWFQTVKLASPTESGLETLALLAGLIAGSIGSGIMVSKTGKYKRLMIGSLVCMTVGLFLMTGLTATTPLPMLWVWMFLTGLGIGPAFSVLTIVIQSVVPFERLGVASGNLTFFRQIGGSVGLAIVGTLFASAFREQIPVQLTKAGVPPQIQGELFGSAAMAALRQPGAHVRDAVAAIPALQQFVDQITNAVFEAFSYAVASTFWLGIAMGLIALVAVVVALPEVRLRGLGATAAGSTGEPPVLVMAE